MGPLYFFLCVRCDDISEADKSVPTQLFYHIPIGWPSLELVHWHSKENEKK